MALYDESECLIFNVCFVYDIFIPNWLEFFKSYLKLDSLSCKFNLDFDAYLLKDYLYVENFQILNPNIMWVNHRKLNYFKSLSCDHENYESHGYLKIFNCGYYLITLK